MALSKITSEDLTGKGVSGQADVPGLTAAEMQEKIEEIVRSVVIPKFNGNVDETELIFATKAELAQVILESGSILSVFGRSGDIVAKEGDYTPAQVGAAPASHADNHKTGGSDALAPADIGAAPAAHAHGNVTSDGKIGITNGLGVVTGEGGALTALNAAQFRALLSLAAAVHKDNHKTGGSDALTPADIGAQVAGSYATASHNHNSAYSPIVTTRTALPTSGTALVANSLYTPSAAVGTYEFVSPASGWAHGKFTTASSIAITFGTEAKYIGTAPSFAASKTYEFDVLNNVWAIAEVVS